MHESTVAFGFVGLLFFALGAPLAMNKVKPNQWYGFRVPATVKDPAVWYPVNELTGRIMMGTGALVFLAALFLSLWPGLSDDARALALTVLLLAGTLYMTVRGLLLVRDLTR